ncbi:SPG7 matrix AAA peptidase subunit, paraplegin isoform X1 [Lasioglossum baleicum]|uniref:SPG7 matrix AAA peptidase subunit, paraplegin isoform X1 n=2 Tax=Lasioglossum baleicum TaxID=434251 RepID=UPI003FCD7760
MQNLINCPKRRYVVSQRLISSLFKYNWKKHGASNAVLLNISNKVKRLCFPASHRLYIDVCREFNSIRLLLRKNEPVRIYCSPWMVSTRNFSTTSRLSDKNKTNGRSSEKSSKSPDEKPDRDPNFDMLTSKVLLLGFVIILLIMAYRFSMETSKNHFDWNDFVNEMLLKGEVKEIQIAGPVVTVLLHPGAIYKGHMTMNKSFTVIDFNYANTMEDKIRELEKKMGISAENGIPIRYIRKETENSIFGLLFFGAILYLLVRIFRTQKFRNPMDFITQKKSAKYTLVEPFSGKGVHFKDVAGLNEAKTEVMEFVDYLKHPERYKKLGAKVPKGALLLGPPGCGKTLLAKAVATESDVPFLSMNGSEFIEMLGGLGAARVRDLFAQAKKRAPSIIYIDEIDAVGKKRSEGRDQFGNNESERTLNQLLVEMDGMTTAQDVIILASTNRADVLDKALLRPGRFDRHILIDLPTLDERKQIFECHLKTLSLEGKPNQYSGYLAYLTPGFSGADIANVCNESALHAARDKKTSIGSNDLLYAIDRTIGGIAKKTGTLTQTTKKVVAYHEAGRALVGWLLEHTDALLKVTIVPRTHMSLGFSQYTPTDQKLYSKEQLFEKMCMMIGGRVAEILKFNRTSTAAENELKKITKMAYSQVQQFGMSPNVGLISFDEEATSTKVKKLYSKRMANLMDVEVRKIVTEVYKATEKLLIDNDNKLELLAEELLKKETLTYDDLVKLLGPPPHGKKRLVEPAEFIADAAST